VVHFDATVFYVAFLKYVTKLGWHFPRYLHSTCNFHQNVNCLAYFCNRERTHHMRCSRSLWNRRIGNCISNLILESSIGIKYKKYMPSSSLYYSRKYVDILKVTGGIGLQRTWLGMFLCYYVAFIHIRSMNPFEFIQLQPSIIFHTGLRNFHSHSIMTCLSR
jgi:hypothetical protein